jgi:hypothetical protein
MKPIVSVVLCVFIIVALISPVFSSAVDGQVANPPDIYAPAIVRFITSYGNIQNGSVIFDRGNFNVNVSAEAPWSVYRRSTLGTVMAGGIKVSASYKTNWQLSVGIFPSTTTTITHIPHGHRYIQVTGTTQGNLVNLGSGNSAFTPFSYTDSQTLDFNLETFPTISATSPKNQTYNSDYIAINLTVNGNYVTLYYSLDGETAIEINGNSTLTGLSYSSHNLVIYACDTLGSRTDFNEIWFAVAKPELASFSSLTITLSLVSIICVATAALIYSSRYRKAKQNNQK